MIVATWLYIVAITCANIAKNATDDMMNLQSNGTLIQ